MEEIVIEPYSFPRCGNFLIIGNRSCGKTELARDILRQHKPKVKIIFTECPIEWSENEPDNSGIVWPMDKYADNSVDVYKHIITRNYKTELHKFTQAWSKINSDAKIVFIFDSIKWDGMETSQDLRYLFANRNATVVITYDPVTPKSDYSLYLGPELRNCLNAIFLNTTQSKYLDQIFRIYLNNKFKPEQFLAIIRECSRYTFMVVDDPFTTSYKHYKVKF